MPEILLAYESRIDFLSKTNPFKSSKPERKPGDPLVITEPLPSKEEVANAWREFARQSKER